MIFVSILCISIGAGASGVQTCGMTRILDSLMNRTKSRPIPQGKIMALDALGFGVILSLVSVLVLGLVKLFCIILIVLFYFFLCLYLYNLVKKRKTPQNIVIGGAAGAFPPVIGWACSTGDISLFPINSFDNLYMDTSAFLGVSTLQRCRVFKSKKSSNATSCERSENYKKTNIYLLDYSIGSFSNSILLDFSGLFT